MMSRTQHWRAHLRLAIRDHGFLRVFWSNMHEIAPGVWRSNQPPPGRMRAYAKMGLKAVLNLRGGGNPAPGRYSPERHAADKAGLRIHSLGLKALKPASRECLLDLLSIFESIERPFVMHCKSGSDRTGLAAALWLLHMEGRTPAEAKAMLSLRYLHLRAGRAGIQSRLIDQYAAQNAISMLSVKDWIINYYDPKSLLAADDTPVGPIASPALSQPVSLPPV
jgi:protein tyrosine phosphatase (PTP) superfamily phosphohydrolase (DUF442 family)